MNWTVAETIGFITWTIGGLAIAGAFVYRLYRERKKERKKSSIPKPPF